mmetsp:Transcript_5425/g.18004  ORF Transcript_5425/g.18004 Transcript_5425/m.18004 type:complete len:223 (-) Transcript_5425:147-815(-)|eukprot:CAMPEP_0196687322 /NCGR_PEP_ID=MMETSP1090-20130531/14315_1 /TAXON_ID=37098 /ORGANISM="Isochrysis sp, Strain CCMP1244" /LENGTH=222 /DNA_ID=CAMNT_0042026105 /DNA_START=31 /DNA_END=699 /DNA_ORIENTATION=+
MLSRVSRAAGGPLLAARRPAAKLLRGGQRRGMCAAAEEGPKTVQGISLSNPPITWLVSILGINYLLCFRWAIKDKSLAAKVAEIEAEQEEAKAKVQSKADGNYDLHKEFLRKESKVQMDEAKDAMAKTMAFVRKESALQSGTPLPAAVDTSNPTTWKVSDVLAWLEEEELGDHTMAFKEHAVNGKLLLTLTEQDMYSSLNIVSPLRRKKLTMAIADLRAKAA